jgi:hypothetical protein
MFGKGGIMQYKRAEDGSVYIFFARILNFRPTEDEKKLIENGRVRFLVLLDTIPQF